MLVRNYCCIMYMCYTMSCTLPHRHILWYDLRLKRTLFRLGFLRWSCSRAVTSVIHMNVSYCTALLYMCIFSGVFDVKQTKAILEAGLSAGWKLNFHAEEFHCSNSVEVRAIHVYGPYVCSMSMGCLSSPFLFVLYHYNYVKHSDISRHLARL